MRRHGLRRDPPLAISLCSVSHDVPSSIRRGVHAQLIAEVGDTRARLESVFFRGKDNKLVMLRRLNGGAE